MKKNVYIPMSRMNFLGCLDSLIIAPPDFQKKRKFYEDFTRHFPSHIAAFTIPTVPFLKKDETEFNFFVILQIEITSAVGIKALHLTDHQNIKINSWKSREAETDDLLLLSRPVAIKNIKKVYVENEQQLTELAKDPLFESRGYDFTIEIWKNDIKKTDVFQKVSDCSTQIKKIKGYSAQDYDRLFKTAGGLALLAEVIEKQSWVNSNPYTVAGIDILDAYIGRYIKLEEHDFSELLFFQEIEASKDERIKELKHLFNDENKYSGEYPSTIKPSESENQTEKYADLISDQQFFRLLTEECINGHPKKTAVGEILNNLKRKIKKQVGAEELMSLSERYEKGIQLILDILAGRQQIDLMFTSKTMWARSLRAATLFCLRPRPNDMIVWSGGEKPSGADLPDYLRAAFLCGTYQGFSRLPWKIKKKWNQLINIPVDNQLKQKGQKEQSRTVETKWLLEKNRLLGTFSVWYPKKGKINLKTVIDVKMLVQNFYDRIYQLANDNSLGTKEKAVLSIIANQMGLTYKTITISSEQLIQPGVEVTLSEKDIAISTNWDYRHIIDKLANSNDLIVSEELIHLICHYMEYKTHEFNFENSSHEVMDHTTQIMVKIENYFDKALVKAKTISNVYPELGEIYASGAELGHELVKLLCIKKMGDTIKKEVQSSILYLVIEDEIISEEKDPDFGQIDDWIWLGRTSEKIAETSKRKESEFKRISSLGNTLLEKISKEFGREFVNTSIKKIERAWLI